jgi:hypothetical protein
MNRPTRALILPLLASALLAAGCATASNKAPIKHPRTDYGVAAVHAHRTIVVHDRTRHINVTNGETVQFDVNGQRFAFAFNNWPNKEVVDLSVIAPDGMTMPQVRVYIAPDPMTRG